MTEYKFVVSDPKTGKSYQKMLEENPLINNKYKDKIQGDLIGLSGYELEIRGGSDKSGCPIRYDMPGIGKKTALLSSGPCIKIKARGNKIRKTVVGNTINADIVQVNLKVIKVGSPSLEEIFPKKEEVKTA